MIFIRSTKISPSYSIWPFKTFTGFILAMLLELKVPIPVSQLRKWSVWCLWFPPHRTGRRCQNHKPSILSTFMHIFDNFLLVFSLFLPTPTPCPSICCSVVYNPIFFLKILVSVTTWKIHLSHRCCTVYCLSYFCICSSAVLKYCHEWSPGERQLSVLETIVVKPSLFQDI